MQLSRRRVLQSGVTAGIVGLAGCTSNSDDDSTTAPSGGRTTAEETTTETTTAATTTEARTAEPTTTTAGETATPACGSPEDVSGTITEDTTWECPQYRLAGNVTVSGGATLTVAEGVEVLATQGVRLSAGSGGTLRTEGSDQNPVTFRGEQERPGYWHGIEIATDSVDSTLRGTTVADGGGDDWANVYVQDGASVAVEDCLFEDASTYGLLAESNTDLRAFSSNTLRNNGDASLRVPPSVLESLDTASTYGSADDVSDARVEVAGEAFTTETTMASLDAFYVFPEGARVAAPLTIEPGTSCLFGADTRLVVDQGGSLTTPTDGDSLSAFMGEQRTSGFWQGIEFISDSPDNVLEQIRVQDAGADDWAPVYLRSGSGATLREVTIAKAPAEGLHVETGGSLRGFQNNTFEDSLGTGLAIPLDQLDAVDSQSTFEGPERPGAIRIHEGTVSEAATWRGVQAVVRFETDAVVRAPVTIEAGFICGFESGHRLVVDDGGSLSSVGTLDDRIFISGAYEGGTPVRWQGIEFVSGTGDNRLEHTVVTLGGADDWANVYLQNGSSVSIVASDLDSSETYGLIAEAGAKITEWRDNGLIGNTEGPMRIPAELLGTLDSGTNFGAADEDAPVHVDSGLVSSEATWANVDETVHFLTGARLEAPITIDPGATLTFAEDTRLTVDTGGSLSAVGSGEDDISFLPENIGPRGFWEGIEFVSDDPDNELDNVLVNGGGANGWANVYVQEGGRVALKNSTFVASETYGLTAEADTTLPEFVNNYFGENDGGDMRLPASGLGQIDSVTSYFDSQGTAGRIDVFATPVTEQTTWYATPFTVRFTEGVSIQARVTVRQGTTYTFAQGTRLSVTDGGTLVALGDPDYPITFEGESDVPGFWQGIEFATLRDDNILRDCVVANGGADAWANVYVQSTGMATVEDCTLRDSATFGIIAEEGASLTESGNTFTNNTSGDVST